MGFRKSTIAARPLAARSVAASYLAVKEPIQEAGMQDYRLEQREDPGRHPSAVDRLTGRVVRETGLSLLKILSDLQARFDE